MISDKWLKINISSFQLILMSFMLVIFIGGVLLTLPIASYSGHTSFLDALFTSVSAVCVTGLVVHDTATHWTLFGKAVILLLIQIGGLGVITISIWFQLVAGRRINLFQRLTMQDAIGASQLGGIVRFTRFMLRATLCFELLGAILIFPVMIQRFSPATSLGNSVFYAISAFCNAGFDLSGTVTAPYQSLTGFAGVPLMNIVIMMLIIVGGIGFGIQADILDKKWNIRHFRLQTRIVLITTLILIVLPAIYFFFADFREEALSLRIQKSLFQSVTTRTAGFNTADLGLMSEGSTLLMIFLMLVGGSPGSTAGGVKTTTLAVLVLTMIHSLRGNDNITTSDRTIETSAIYHAITLMMLYVLLLFAGAIIISGIEGLPLIDTAFECASALGTVGLTRGITPTLGTFSKIILMGFMYFGRVGALTIFYAAPDFYRVRAAVQYPKESLMIG
ncbi:TrkH family potassium uptake protein [Oribacterium sp. WCC10]|uniref:TrkH family potassium uptake protein n=1 Tax=Oribacterium sp. WCC10 TaxID=1855343 RepID=UPI0008E95FC7|nr:potassium transporter TrkG [Oribacterium sp. WCC10]SFG65737.1 trk system potassium uptake protein TrkH [Oribacterium sp. WCC10]